MSGEMEQINHDSSHDHTTAGHRDAIRLTQAVKWSCHSELSSSSETSNKDSTSLSCFHWSALADQTTPCFLKLEILDEN